MISYRPFYETLLKKGLTEYHLIYKEGFSANILHRMKHGQNITLKTLDTLCFILDCDISDIIEYVKENWGQACDLRSITLCHVMYQNVQLFTNKGYG